MKLNEPSHSPIVCYKDGTSWSWDLGAIREVCRISNKMKVWTQKEATSSMIKNSQVCCQNHQTCERSLFRHFMSRCFCCNQNYSSLPQLQHDCVLSHPSRADDEHYIGFWVKRCPYSQEFDYCWGHLDTAMFTVQAYCIVNSCVKSPVISQLLQGIWLQGFS